MYTSKFYGEQLKITLDTVLERDMDLLIMEEFISDKDFANIFLDAAKIDRDCEIVSVQRSLRFQMGESDIVIVLKAPQGHKIGLHIEDKVNAEAQQEQYSRYEERARILADGLDYSEYRICIAAPQQYLNTNAEAKKYPAAVSYELIKDHFERRDGPRYKFKLALLHCALGKKDISIAVPNEDVTEFWRDLEALARERGLELKQESDVHGKESKFIRFRTVIPKVYVIYKARHGCVDLQFPGKAGKLVLPKELSSDEMTVCDTGKSASVRVCNHDWAVDLEEGVDGNLDKIGDILSCVDKLCKLAKKIARECPELTEDVKNGKKQ